MTKHNVLVYGTLRPGTARKVTVPAKMFDLGAFPGVKLGEGRVVCELVEVDDDTLQDLDRYEGYYEEAPEHSLYVRRRFVDDEQGVDAWIYEYNEGPCDRSLVPSGDWLEYTGASCGGAQSLLNL